jgi:hypothetical protein
MSHLFCPKKTKQVLEVSPDSGLVSPSVQKLAEDGKLDHIYSIPLMELNCQFGIVRNRVDEPIPLQKAVKRERSRQQSKVTLVFAVRRPG